MKTTITVDDYHQMRPYTQDRLHRFLWTIGLSVTDVFLIETEDETDMQRIDIHFYERNQDGKLYLNTDNEVASRTVTIYTDLYEPIF